LGGQTQGGKDGKLSGRLLKKEGNIYNYQAKNKLKQAGSLEKKTQPLKGKRELEKSRHRPQYRGLGISQQD